MSKRKLTRRGRSKICGSLSNSANEAFANICLQSFQEAQIPPIPPDLVATLPDGQTVGRFFLYDLRQPMMPSILILAQLPQPVNAVWQFFSSGGLFMWPLLVCSILAVTTIILRGMALRRKNVLPLVIESEIERLVPGGSPERLARIAQQDDSSLGRVWCGRRCSICALRAAKPSKSSRRRRDMNSSCSSAD